MGPKRDERPYPIGPWGRTMDARTDGEWNVMSAPTLRRDPARVLPPRVTEALFEATPGGLVVTDRRGTIQWADRCFARWCGSDEDELHDTCIAWVMPGAWRVLRGVRDRKEVVIDTTVRSARGGARAVRVHAAGSRRWGSGTVVWFVSEDTPAPAAATAPVHRDGAAESVDESFHLDALRLLHELASAPRDEDAAVMGTDPRPLESLPVEPVPMD